MEDIKNLNFRNAVADYINILPAYFIEKSWFPMHIKLKLTSNICTGHITLTYIYIHVIFYKTQHYKMAK